MAFCLALLFLFLFLDFFIVIIATDMLSSVCDGTAGYYLARAGLDFTMLDANGDGSVSIGEMVGMCDGSVRNTLPVCSDTGLGQTFASLFDQAAPKRR